MPSLSLFLIRQTVTEEPITPARRLAICLYSVGRGDYLYTISEMSGLGVSTVCSICQEVCQVLVDHLWNETCCPIVMKCPPRGLQACKVYLNFKNFYSVILMAMVDSHYRFVWGSCGFPGSSHDAASFRSTDL